MAHAYGISAFVAAFAFSACGGHENDQIPSGLLDAIEGRDAGAKSYPAGPYGSDEGEIAGNVCVRGWHDPKQAEYAEDALGKLCFSDFWDPEATQHSLLLINTSALWCTACRSEYGGTQSRPSLGDAVKLRHERGLRVLGVLFQDAQRNPATSTNAALWASTFEVGFPFGFDEPFAMGQFADPILQPFNMVLDTRTMRIVLTLQGDDPETLWPTIDERLASEP
jgi:hypothetical protein